MAPPAPEPQALSKAVPPRSPRVRLVAAWIDPRDQSVWSRTLSNLTHQLEELGVWDGYQDATPWPPAAHLVRRWLARTGRLDQSWTLRAEMRLLIAACNATRRPRTPAEVDAWLVPVNVFGQPVTGRLVTWSEMSPSQIAAAYPTHVGSLGFPDLLPRGLASLVRQQERIYRRASVCCVAAEWAGRSLVKDHGVSAARVKVVGYGPNLELAPPPERDWRTPRYLFVGRDWGRKNGDAAVRAFRRLRQEVPEAELHLEGFHPRMDEDGVIGHGRLAADTPEGRAELQSLFARATCFVLPSFVEPFGIVYVEAATAGLASVATSVGGTLTAVGDGGVLVDPHDHDALYRAMRQLARPETARTLGARALARSSLFSWRKSAERLVRAVDPELADAEGFADFL
jgi:glycosyltransferase involved in cell wall biosynthesis